ncbi:MAG: hypothetical protein ACI4WM_02370 [Erysipelotrichaceae bacterium]
MKTILRVFPYEKRGLIYAVYDILEETGKEYKRTKSMCSVFSIKMDKMTVCIRKSLRGCVMKLSFSDSCLGNDFLNRVNEHLLGEMN